MRAAALTENGGGAGGQGARAVATVGYVGDEEVNDAMDLDIEKVRHTTCRTDFSEGSLGCWNPGDCLRETDRTSQQGVPNAGSDAWYSAPRI